MRENAAERGDAGVRDWRTGVSRDGVLEGKRAVE